MKRLLLSSSIFAILLFGSCKKEKIEQNLIGTWVFEYEILDDCLKKYDNPYALLDFTYSDGFVLNDDGSGSTTWYNSPGGEIEWSNTKNKLIIHDQYWSGELIDYNYSIKDIKSTSLVFENYKGHKYYMKKQ